MASSQSYALLQYAWRDAAGWVQCGDMMGTGMSMGIDIYDCLLRLETFKRFIKDYSCQVDSDHLENHVIC